MSKQDEEISEEKNEKVSKKKTDEPKKETIVTVEAPKTRLITAFVMLSGSAFVAIYTYIQHYEIGDWLRTLFIAAVIFLIAGLLLEWLITHFSGLIQSRDDAIKEQEDAIAARQADELAAQEAAAEAERQAALEAEEAEQQQTNTPDGYDAFGESDEFGGFDDTSGF